MRGALSGRHIYDGSGRIIPADAGSTWPASRAADHAWDHPRGCGEHAVLVFLELGFQGSSPRMRGAHGGQGLDLLVDRMRGAQAQGIVGDSEGGIIPADAGSTYCPKYNGSSHWDHPRGCGEHACCAHLARDVGGSSPRMRGARSCPMPYALFYRSPDHPRGCGEHATTISAPVVVTGIIPADAGSTPRSHSPRCSRWDHPRGCGEHTPITLTSMLDPGSSPRMRGAR